MRKTLLGVVALLGVFANSEAAIINYETRDINQAINNLDYQASWQAQTSTVTSQTLADFNGIVVPGGVAGGFSHLQVSFNTLSNLNNWSVRLAPDAGYGGALYLDGQLLDRKSYDLWWGGNWNYTSQILSGNLNLVAGNHVLSAFWAEGCCNGGQSLQYSTDGQTWQSFTTLANPSQVPVPGAAWLCASGLFGMLGLGRRRPVA